MDKALKDAVWKDFWDRQRTAQSAAVVSQQWSAISRAQFDAWVEVSEIYPQGGKILDLATGAGKLPEMLLTARPDLTFVGVDIADPLPEAPSGIELMGGISMEELPFEGPMFHAAVSQFGFEYGDTGVVAGEILRVLHPGSPIALMVHRGDGPILAHNRKREEQLRWVIDENALFTDALAQLEEDHADPQASHDLAAKLAREGHERFGPQTVAWEVPEAVRRTIDLGKSGPRAKLLDTLRFIEQQAQNERGRIASLAQACATSDDRDALLAGFTAKGRKVRETRPVALPNEPPFADLILL